MPLTVDLNCDMGESFGDWNLGQDETMMEYVTSVNVACGFHAGDPRVIQGTVQRAKRRGVRIGAHPGVPDLVGFGRRELNVSALEAYTDVLYQLGALSAFCRAQGVKLQHVKAHGHLGHLSYSDARIADAIIHAVKDFHPDLILMQMAFSDMGRRAEAAGLRVAWEVYCDRTYQADGRLVPRSQPGAMITDPDEAAQRVVEMVLTSQVRTVKGTKLTTPIDTVCVHGDTPGAVRIAANVREQLERSGVHLRALGA